MSVITFSRHAKRRIDLYDISRETILQTIEQHIKTMNRIEEGKTEIVSNNLSRYGYPIKIVFAYENNSIIVITAYPLKKGRKP